MCFLAYSISIVLTVAHPEMAFSILPPVADDIEAASQHADSLDEDSDVSMGDEEDRPAKRFKISASRSIVVPGEIITDETQWMRYVDTTCLGTVFNKHFLEDTAPTILHSQPASLQHLLAPSRRPTSYSQSILCVQGTHQKSET